MISAIRACGLLGLAAVAIAGPVVVRSPDIEAVSVLEKRLPSIALGDFDLTTSHQNDVLFNIGFGSTSGRVGDAFHLSVECVDCRTWGWAYLSTAGVTKKDDIIGDIISFFENPLDTVVEAFDLNVRIDFVNVGGHFDFELLASNTVSYSFPIFTVDSPLGFEISEDVSFGLVLSIDLVFSLTTAIDLEAGFEFAFPEGAYITVDPISGNIVDQGFTGGDVNNLPVIIHSGSATFKAALRVRIEAGTTIELFGTGFDFELGVYADLIEYVATIGTSDTCELYITESIDVNIGAYAHAVVDIDYHTFGASPAIVTTLLEYPLPSLCLTRPAETGLPSLPTASVSIVTSGDAAISTPAVEESSPPAAISTPSAAVSTSAPALPTSNETTPGGVFQQTPKSTITPTTHFVVSASPTGYANSTITSAPVLTTSTVYATSLITITACADTVLHCPGSLTSEIIVTSTKVLYTTVCPVGEVQPTTLPSSFKPTIPASVSSSYSTAKPVITKIISAYPLTPCATPIVETIYTPTFVNPTYVIPTATSFTVPHPYWNVTQTATIVPGGQIASTVIVVPTYIPTSSPSGVVPPTESYPTYIPTSSPSGAIPPPGSYPTYIPTSSPSGAIPPPANSTVSGSVSPPKPTIPAPFTGAAARIGGNSVFGLVILVGAGVLAML